MSTVLTASGGCECGAVRYEVRGPLRKVAYCHCVQCRRTSGHFVAATACATDDLTLVEDRGLQWYVSSDIADRGFCKLCGSSIFYRPNHRRHISIMAGTVDAPTGLKSHAHIFVADAADYYTIDDGVPQFPGDVPREDLWVESER